MTSSSSTSPRGARPVARLLDGFFLRRAIARAVRFPRERRAAAERALELARQRSAAAETLWSARHCAEALRLEADALSEALEGAARLALPPLPVDGGLAEVEGAAPPAAADTRAPLDGCLAFLRERGVAEADLVRLAAIEAERRAEPLPRLDDDVSPAHHALYQRLQAARRLVERTVREAALTPMALRGLVAVRVAVALAVTGAVAFGARALLDEPDFETVASAHYDKVQAGVQIHRAASATDGDTKTEWQLPDRQAGWIEVRFRTPREVREVRLLNAHNPHWNDRATKDYRVELRAGGRAIATTTGRFAALSTTPSWVTHPLRAPRVDAIRVEIQSHFRLGGGLAEIGWR